MLPEAAAELHAFGLRILPVVVIDGVKVVAGFDVPALKRLLGIRTEMARDLPSSKLLIKYRVFFQGAKRAVLQIPNDKLDWVTPEKERRGQTLRLLAFHLFDRPDVCMNAARSGQYTYEMCHEYEHVANTYRTTRDIVAYADIIMARIEGFLTNESDPTEAMVQTYFGPQSVGKLFNMALVGTGLRIKQTYYFLRAIGIEPKEPLGDEDFSGVFIPTHIFG